MSPITIGVLFVGFLLAYYALFGAQPGHTPKDLLKRILPTSSGDATKKKGA